jgi:hypothetical protein
MRHVPRNNETPIKSRKAAWIMAVAALIAATLFITSGSVIHSKADAAQTVANYTLKTSSPPDAQTIGDTDAAPRPPG